MNMIPQMPDGIDRDQIEDLKRIADAVTWEEAAQVLHSDERRAYQVDIETDSTVFQDSEAEKMARMEYMRAMTEMLMTALPTIKENPSLGPMIKEAVMFASRGFKVGRVLEESLEEGFDSIRNAPPKSHPEESKIQAEMEIQKAEMAMRREGHQLEMESRRAEMQMKQQDAVMEFQKQQAEMRFKEIEAKLDLVARQLDLQMQREQMGFKREEAQMKVGALREKTLIDRNNMVFNSQMKRQETAERAQERLQAAAQNRQQA